MASAPGAPNPINADVAVDPSGNVFVAYVQGDNSARSVWLNRFDATHQRFDGSVASPIDKTGFADEVRIVSGRDGSVMAIYGHVANSAPGAYAVRYDAKTGRFDRPVQIDQPSTAGSSDLDLVIDDAGNATAVWVQMLPTTGPWQNLYAARFDSAQQTWSRPMRLDTLDTGHDNHPHLAADPFGNVVVAWHQGIAFDGGGGIWAARYDAACGTWSPAARIDDGISPKHAGGP